MPGSIFFGRITDGASPQDGVITALLVTVTTYLLAAVAGFALPKPRPSETAVTVEEKVPATV
ncbi:hypothetical protein ABIB56_003279 [Glaciihabitans sp. UYNi722]